MGRLRWGWAALAAVAGCVDATSLALPEAGPDVGARILVLQSGEAQQVWVLDPKAPERVPEPRFVSADARLFLYEYPGSPETLGLPLGRHEPAPGDVRTLPPTGGYSGALEGRAVAWRPEADLAVLAALRWPPMNWQGCLQAGWCGRRPSPSAPLECSPDCAPSPPARPTAPALPSADLWTTRALPRGPALPYPGPAPALECGTSEAHWYGEAACAPARPCAGTWPPAPAGALALYVQAGAVGGDGTPDAPLGELAEALARAAPGGAVLLAAGRYPAPARLRAAVSLLGACPEAVQLTLPPGVAALGLEADGLRLAGLALPPLLVSSSVSVDASIVTAGEATGVTVEAQGILHARRLLLEAGGGEGVSVAGTADLRGLVVRGARGRAVRSQRGVLRLEAVRLSGTRSAPGEEPTALVCRDCQLEVEGLEVTDNAANGVLIVGAEARAALRDVRVHQAFVNTLYAGVRATEGAQLTGEQLYVGGAAYIGLHAGQDAQVSLRDVVVEGCGAAPRTDACVVLEQAGSVVMERVFLADELARPLRAQNTPPQQVLLQDLTVVSGAPDTVRGVLDLEEGRITISRVAVYATDANVIATQVDLPAEIVIHDLHSEGGRTLGKVSGNVKLSVARAEVLDTTAGPALTVGSGSVGGAPGLFLGQDVHIRTPGATPIVSSINGQVSLDRFLLEGPAPEGVVSVADGQVSLRDGELRDFTVGVAFRDLRDYPVEALVERVRFTRVEVPVDAPSATQ